MYLIALAAVVIAVGLAVMGSGTKTEDGKKDLIGWIFTLVIILLDVPASLYGFFSVFAADSLSLYSPFFQKIIELLICLGLSLPFLSAISIAGSVILRKKGKLLLGYGIGLIPFLLFLILVASFEAIGSNLP